MKRQQQALVIGVVRWPAGRNAFPDRPITRYGARTRRTWGNNQGCSSNSSTSRPEPTVVIGPSAAWSTRVSRRTFPLQQSRPWQALQRVCGPYNVINSGGSGRNYTRNSGSGPLPLPLWGSALNFASCNFAVAILNSGLILRPQLHVADRNSIETNIPN
jgi:hypothetical protein